MSRVPHRILAVLVALSAAVALTWLAGTASAQAPAAEPPAAPSESQKTFDAAKALYDEGKWTEALAAFQNFEKKFLFSNLAGQGIYFEGWCLSNLQRSADAAKAFDRLVNTYPLTPIVPAALIKEAECYRASKDFIKAQATYQRFFDKFTKNELMPQALLSQAATYNRQYLAALEDKQPGDPKLLATGERIARNVLAQYQNDTGAMLDALSLLGQILNEQKKFDEARQVYDLLKKQRNNPRATDALFMEGESMYDAKRFEEAISYYQQVRSKAALIADIQNQIEQLRARIPHELESRNFLAAQIQSLRQLEAQIAAGNDLRASALFRIANCYASLGRPEEASIVYRHFMRLFPKDSLIAKAEIGLIQALTERGQPKLADEESERFYREHPDAPKDLLAYATFLQAKSEFDTEKYLDAQKHFKKLIAETKDPEMKQTAEFFVASCAYMLGQKASGEDATTQYAAARDAFAQFIKHYPESKSTPDAMFRLGRAYFALSQQAGDDAKMRQESLQGAVNAFEEIRAKHPRPDLIGDVTFQLGYLYTYLGDFDTVKTNKPSFAKAVAAFREFVKNWPKDDKACEAAYQIELVLLTDGKLDEAIAAAKFVLDEYGECKFACFAAFDIGKAYAMANKPPEMVKALRAYIERCPSHIQVPLALYAIADDEEKGEKAEAAITDYHQLITVAGGTNDPPADLLKLTVQAEARVAAILEGQGKVTEAVTDCEGYLAKFIDHPVCVREIINQIISLYRNAKKYTEAYAKLDELGTKYQQNASVRVAALTGVIELALTKQDYSRAHDTALKLLADPEKDKLPGLSYIAIGNAMFKSGDCDSARDAFEKALAIASTDARLLPPSLLGLGQANLGLKKFDDAEAAIKKAFAGNPEGQLVLDGRMVLAKVDLAKGLQAEASGNKNEATPRLKEAVDLLNFVMANAKGDQAGEAALALGNFFLTHEKDCKTALPYLLRVLFLAGEPFAEEAMFRVGEANECLSSTLTNQPERDAARETARTSYRNYLKRYPSGKFAPDAQKRLDALPAAAPAP